MDICKRPSYIWFIFMFDILLHKQINIINLEGFSVIQSGKTYLCLITHLKTNKKLTIELFLHAIFMNLWTAFSPCAYEHTCAGLVYK